MSGQYSLTEEENKLIKEIIEKYIHSYRGDLYKDNEISIRQHETDDEELTDDFMLCLN